MPAPAPNFVPTSRYKNTIDGLVTAPSDVILHVKIDRLRLLIHSINGDPRQPPTHMSSFYFISYFQTYRLRVQHLRPM